MHLPYLRPQSQVSFLSLPIAFHDSHRSFTDPEHKARSHHIPPLMLPRDPEQIHRFRRPQPTHHHHLILAHRPNHHAQPQTFPRRLCACCLLYHPSILFSPKMQLLTLTRSLRPRHRRRQPQTRRPHRHLLQTHHNRQQREGNSHAAHLFRRGLC